MCYTGNCSNEQHMGDCNLTNPDCPKEKRYCKGCHADVTETMFCHCGEFALLESETLSEAEINQQEKQYLKDDSTTHILGPSKYNPPRKY